MLDIMRSLSDNLWDYLAIGLLYFISGTIIIAMTALCIGAWVSALYFVCPKIHKWFASKVVRLINLINIYERR
jgi:ABC-type phosphate transport system permease subunit